MQISPVEASIFKVLIKLRKRFNVLIKISVRSFNIILLEWVKSLGFYSTQIYSQWIQINLPILIWITWIPEHDALVITTEIRPLYNVSRWIHKINTSISLGDLYWVFYAFPTFKWRDLFFKLAFLFEIVQPWRTLFDRGFTLAILK